MKNVLFDLIYLFKKCAAQLQTLDIVAIRVFFGVRPKKKNLRAVFVSRLKIRQHNAFLRFRLRQNPLKRRYSVVFEVDGGFSEYPHSNRCVFKAQLVEQKQAHKGFAAACAAR